MVVDHLLEDKTSDQIPYLQLLDIAEGLTKLKGTDVVNVVSRALALLNTLEADEALILGCSHENRITDSAIALAAYLPVLEEHLDDDTISEYFDEAEFRRLCMS